MVGLYSVGVSKRNWVVSPFSYGDDASRGGRFVYLGENKIMNRIELYRIEL